MKRAVSLSPFPRKARRATPLPALLLAALTAAGCGKGTPAASIMPPETQLRAGDLVFRQGGGITSRAVLLADRNGSYSHIGIVVDSSGHPMVVHAVPGEPDFEGDPDRVKMEKPSVFFRSDRANIGEVCRPTDSVAGQRAAEEALRLYHRRVLFDHDYDAADTTRMYCTEMVVFCYAKAGQRIVGEPTHEFSFPGLQTTCWLPSDLHDSRCFTSVTSF